MLYQEANRNYHNCENEVTDNLVKQAKTICNPSKDDFNKYFSEFQLDSNEVMGDIKEKISNMQARDFLATWTQIQNDHQTELNRLNRIKDNSDNTDDDKHKI